MTSDLSPAAIKLARRLQALPAGRFYLAILYKAAKIWLLGILTPRGIKAERIQGE
jgi:hypothetical protein